MFICELLIALSGQVMQRRQNRTVKLRAQSPVKRPVTCGHCLRPSVTTPRTSDFVSQNRSFDFPANGLFTLCCYAVLYLLLSTHAGHPSLGR